MLKVNPKDKRVLLKAALGLVKSDLCLVNAKLVNVFTGEVYPADVYVKYGFIAHIEDKPENMGLEKAKELAESIYDVAGRYLIPGLVDSHMHIESSMMTPRNLAKAIIPNGTTTIIHDPHELGNVYGVEGVKYMHDAGADLPMRQLVDIPSCVPAVPGCENAGATFMTDEINELAKLDRVVGLAEVMDLYGVINGEDRMMDIIQAVKDKGMYIQGHAPRFGGRNLSAYLIGGPSTCHETTVSEEALDKLRNGMYVDARESSISKNVSAIWEGIKDCKFFDTLTLCTDDRESDDLLNVGHLNAVVRKAIEVGMDPVAAIKSASINTAREIGMEHIGAIAPGYAADMSIVSELEKVDVDEVFFGGKLVAKGGKMVEKIADKPFEIETRNSMNVGHLTVDDFRIKAPIQNGEVTVNVLSYVDKKSVYTKLSVEKFKVVDGELQLPENVMFAAVVNRYGKGTRTVHVVRNFGLETGAVASTVSHDSHNLTIVFDKPENAFAAAEELVKVGGGMTAVDNGKVLGTLALEVGGLMTHLEAAELSVKADEMKKIEASLGLREFENPLLRIVTMALPVAPEVKLSDLGLIEVATKKIIPLFAE
ncbi:MAG: adenine deaminase C-terminal domain-containing protein [Lachnospiraceae bacterium]|nr:adenine deaminase C-terminal domain-containing protein [Lachnospiraceae bacterium]